MSCFRTFQGDLFTLNYVHLHHVNRFQNISNCTVLLFIVSLNSGRNSRKWVLPDFSNFRDYFKHLGHMGHENWKFQHTT